MAGSRLYIDTEVRAPYRGALNELGLDGYSRHPDTRLLLLQYAIDDGPVTVIDVHHGAKSPGAHNPQPLVDAMYDPSVTVVAQNAQFDRVVLRNVCKVNIPIERWDDTKSRAYTVGLPGDLDTLSRIFNLGELAKKDGKRLIQLFCEQGADPDEHLVDWLLFMDYAAQDIEATRQLDKLLPAWNWTEREQALYHLDQEINDRGFAVDTRLAQEIIEASELAQADLNKQIQKLSGYDPNTGKGIEKGTQRAKVQEFIGSVPDMRAETLRKALRDPAQFTPEQIKMIELRLLSSKSSIAKCRTLLRQNIDSRIRYTMNYHGGGRIGRWSHKGFQPGNMPRPTMEPEDIETAIAALSLGGATAYTLYGDHTLEMGANAIRGLIVAAPGKKLVAADYSNVEGRKIVWYADETWKLEAYRAGKDMYRMTGSRMTGRDPDDFTKKERQGFKGCELSMNYEGGVGAYVNVANAYQVDLVALAKEAPAILGKEYIERGKGSWSWAVRKRETEGLPMEVYVACAAYKFAWRDACPATVKLWADLLDAAKGAVRCPGRAFTVAGGKVTLQSSSGWLAVKIPSGRLIMFAKPQITMERQYEYTPEGEKVEIEPREVLTALKSPTWRREHIYGGLLANAITQGGCRDILADGILRASADGWPIVLHVHDEIVAELPAEDPRDHRDLEALMCALPAWCADMPIAAEGFTGRRYKK